MYDVIFIGLFFVSLLPTTMLAVLFNHEWNKFQNPFTRQKQSQFNRALALAVSVATVLFFALLSYV